MNMRALTRIAGAAGLLVALTASAQEAPQDRTPPPSTGASDEQPPAQTLPPCPQPGQAAAPTEAAPPPPAPPPVEAPAPVVAHHNRIFAPQEISLTTGAGPANYFGTALNSSTDVGAGWDARVTFGARSAIGLEAAYVGSSNTVDMGSGLHARLNSNGFDGDLRFGLPTVVQPYVFGGVGYNHMAVSRRGANDSPAGPLSSQDEQVTVPAGGGVTGYIGKHATVDLRGTYRFIPDNGITPMGTGNLHQWTAQAHVGWLF